MSEKPKRINLIVAGVMLGVFLAGIDATVVGTAMPTVVADLGGLNLYSWVFTSYMLTTAVFMPLFGKMSDLWGRKRLFFISVAFFLLGSILSGTAQNMLQLVLYRVVQGIGSGGMAAIPFAIIGSVFPPEKRGRAFGLIAAVWGISSIVGPALGSFIVMHASWRWVFYINIPFGLSSVALITAAYHETVKRSSASVDVRGAISLGATLVAILLAFFEVGRGGALFTIPVLVLVLLFVLMINLFVRVERGAAEPILPLQFFRIKSFAASNICGFIGAFAIFGGVAFVPLFIQSVQGGSAMKAAMVITPMSIGWSGASITAGQILHKVGARKIVLVGMAFMAVGFLLASFVSIDTPLYYMMVSATAIGVGMGVQTPALLTTAQNSLHSGVLGVATSTQMLSRMVGGATGTAIMGAALTHSMRNEFENTPSGFLAGLPETLRSHLGEPHRLLSESMRSNLDPEHLSYILNVFSHALHNVFLTGLIVAVLGIVASTFLPRS
jgi:EmrB/QacA subfamily drug resistance transporter